MFGLGAALTSFMNSLIYQLFKVILTLVLFLLNLVLFCNYCGTTNSPWSSAAFRLAVW